MKFDVHSGTYKLIFELTRRMDRQYLLLANIGNATQEFAENV